MTAVLAGAAHPTRAREDTGRLLRRLVINYHEASASGGDDDLLAVQDEASAAIAAGVDHEDLILLLAQVHLDSHDLAAAERVLQKSAWAAASAGGLTVRSALLRQGGQLGEAGRMLFGLLPTQHSTRAFVGIAGLYDDLGAAEVADAWYAAALPGLDVKQLGLLAWIEVQRARLRRRRGDLAAADRHLRVAECAVGGWSPLVERARWQEAGGRFAEAATSWQQAERRTRRPDHRHALAVVLRRCGRNQAATDLFASAADEYRERSTRLPWRYLHHQVQWHLEVDGDLDAAVELGRRDFSARPNPHTGRRLVGALSARGEDRAAADLSFDLERQRRVALDQLERGAALATLG